MPGTVKYIEIENFKSFKGKQLIGPFKNFTAIIGPNGSGKSNLMDAISFVLGERASTLRVRKLNELIHGAQISCPLSNRSSVRMIFDYEGVETVFERTIVDNSSYYKINDNPVSWIIYSDALLQVGIPPKNNNFLVFQGSVESIAMKSAKERTEMFETISGSRELKDSYETAKQTMAKANQETQTHYLRKQLIAGERRDAIMKKDENERYKQILYDHDLKRVQIHLLRLYINERSIHELDGELAERNAKLEDITSEITQTDELMLTRKKDYAKLARDVGKVEQNRRELEMDLLKMRPQFFRSKELSNHMGKKLEMAQKNLKAAETQERSNRDEIVGLEEALRNVDMARQNWKDCLLEKGFDLEDSQMEEYRRLRKRADRETADICRQQESVLIEQRMDEAALLEFTDRKNDIEHRLEQKKELLSNNIGRIDKLNEYLEASRKLLEDQKKKQVELSTCVDCAQSNIVKIKGEMSNIDEELSQANVDCNDSSNLRKRAEIVENLKKLYRGVYGRMVDLCQATHKRYQLSVTKVFGGYMEAIVCDTAQTARDCVVYLKERMLGPETFIPVASVTTEQINEKLRDIKTPKNVKLVFDVLRFSPAELRRAVLFVCGNTLICETTEDARRVAFDLGDRKKTVSLDGTLFQRSGIISGGTSNLRAKARRWDERGLTRLREKRAKLVQDLNLQISENRKEFELSNLRTQIHGLETRIKFSLSEKDTLENKLILHNKVDVTALETELNSLQPALTDLQGRVDSRKEILCNLQTSKNEIDDGIFSDFCVFLGIESIRQFEEEELVVHKERMAKRLEFDNQRSRILNQLEYEKSRDTKDNITKWRRIAADNQWELNRLKIKEIELEKTLEDVEKNIEGLGVVKTRIISDMEALDDQLTSLKRITDQFQNDLTNLQRVTIHVENKCEQKRYDRHSLLKSCKLEGIEIPLVSGSIDTFTVSIEDSQPCSLNTFITPEVLAIYEREGKVIIDYSSLTEQLKAVVAEGDVVDKLQTELDELTCRLDSFVNPNMRAGERLDGLSDRFVEAVSEFENARVKTQKAREEFEIIKKKRLELFQNCFSHVSAVIDTIYKELSGHIGAQAVLSPKNTKEPYLEGISFNCLAPGKRYRTVDNMSGGEKTLAALALLFSMHCYKPSPFFVLDEIDSALDNTNMNRLATYIRKQSLDSFQCIVISHKEELYNRADCLIGIYPQMNEPCMQSNILTLDLTPYRDDFVDN